MPTLSAFADEIGADIHLQVKVLNENQVRFVELRGAFHINVLKFSPDQIAEIKKAFANGGIKVSCIGSPIGKIKITDPFEPHFVDFKVACERAEQFDCRYIRIFSYYPPEGGNIADYKKPVFERMEAKLEEAKRRGLILVHENESNIYGNIPPRAVELAKTFTGPNFTNAFDAANYVVEGCLPCYETCWLPIRDYVGYYHLKDAVRSGQEWKCVPVGEGQGEWPQVLADVKARDYHGFMAIEPHLQAAGQMSGFSGPDLFGAAVRAIRRECQNVGLSLD